jgi:hypothetical protein
MRGLLDEMYVRICTAEFVCAPDVFLQIYLKCAQTKRPPPLFASVALQFCGECWTINWQAPCCPQYICHLFANIFSFVEKEGNAGNKK